VSRESALGIGKSVSSVLKRRVVKPSEERRREILEASLSLFTQKGYDETTVDDIATAAGVAKGTIYIYFASKEHILIALKRQFVEGMVNTLTEVIADAVERLESGEQVDYRDVIDDIFDEIVDYHVQRAQTLQIVVHHSASLWAEALELETGTVALLTSAFIKGMDHGLIHTSDPEMTSRLINAALRDNLTNYLCHGQPEDLERLSVAARELCYKALAPAAPSIPRRPRPGRRRSGSA